MNSEGYTVSGGSISATPGQTKERHENPVKVAGNSAEIRTWYLPSSCLEYEFSNCFTQILQVLSMWDHSDLSLPSDTLR
jgi:hypothetical protein